MAKQPKLVNSSAPVEPQQSQRELWEEIERQLQELKFYMKVNDAANSKTVCKGDMNDVVVLIKNSCGLRRRKPFKWSSN
jgi:hypothetical protein